MFTFKCKQAICSQQADMQDALSPLRNNKKYLCGFFF